MMIIVMLVMVAVEEVKDTIKREEPTRLLLIFVSFFFSTDVMYTERILQSSIAI